LTIPLRRNPSPNLTGVPQRVFQGLNGGDYVIGGNRSTQDFIQNDWVSGTT